MHTNLNLNGPWWPEGQSDVDAICGLVSYLHIFTQDPTLFLSFFPSKEYYFTTTFYIFNYAMPKLMYLRKLSLSWTSWTWL